MKRAVEYLTLEDVLEIGEALIPNFQIRDLGLLESAVNRPGTVIYGNEVYPDLASKIAALMHSIAANHALVDGNKRISWACGKVMALINNFTFHVGVDEAESEIIALASGKHDVNSLREVIQDWLIENE